MGEKQMSHTRTFMGTVARLISLNRNQRNNSNIRLDLSMLRKMDKADKSAMDGRMCDIAPHAARRKNVKIRFSALTHG